MKLLLTLLSLIVTLSHLAQVTAIADMNMARNAHQATALANGDVLVTGGFGNGDYHDSAERWDATADQWELVDEMSSARWNHTATLLTNGKVLVTGGWDGQAANHMDTEIFNPDFDTWEPGPDMSVARSNHRAVELENGSILIIGGFNGIEDQVSCDVYDPGNNTITPTGDLNFARSSCTATLLADGRVMVTGGFNPDYGFQMDECEIYDPSTGEWTEVSPLSTPTDNHAAILLSGGDLLVAGGRWYNSQSDAYEGQTASAIYSVSDDSWLDFEMDKGHSYCSLYDLGGLAVVLPGGADDTGVGVTITTSSTSQFEAFGNEWFNSSNWASDGRYRYASCELSSGEVLVCGGEDDASAVIFQAAMSVQENQRSLMMYPNPAVDQVYIDIPESNWRGEIRNSQGKLVQLLSPGQRSIDIGHLPAGLYLVSATGSSESYVSKLIVR